MTRKKAKEADKQGEIKKMLSLFKFSISGRVKFAEVDSFGIVHNIQYHYWLEWARLEYLRKIGLTINEKTFIIENPVMVVHSEIDFFNAARFNDEYKVLTRVAYLGNSSLGFENLVLLKDGTLLAKAKTTLININPKDKSPEKINDYIRTLVRIFEGDNVEFID